MNWAPPSRSMRQSPRLATRQEPPALAYPRLHPPNTKDTIFILNPLSLILYLSTGWSAMLAHVLSLYVHAYFCLGFH